MLSKCYNKTDVGVLEHVLRPDQNLLNRSKFMASPSLANKTTVFKACAVSGCPDRMRARGWCNRHYKQNSHKWKGTAYHKIPLAARFWPKVAITANPDKCWEWQCGRKRDDHYGIFWYDGRTVAAHRAMWFIVYGEWPVQPLLHSCDNPPCVNPAHLREGTPQENAADMVLRNRQARGERSPKAKLSEADVRMIRQSTLRTRDLKKMFGLSGYHIYMIKRRLTWAWMD